MRWASSIAAFGGRAAVPDMAMSIVLQTHVRSAIYAKD
jgi:hypothetical protein